MKTLILYYSKHGTGDKCTKLMEAQLKGEVLRVNLRDRKAPSVDGFDRFVIGGSIHMGRINRKLRHFCTSRLPDLLKKDVGLFFCCLTPEEKCQEYYDKNLPAPLVEHAKTRGILGGALYFERMNFLESFMLKKVVGSDENQETIDPERIRQFVEDLEA